MIKTYCFMLVSLYSFQVLYAQKEDANWVFGLGCGINFDNPAEPVIFPSNAVNSEASASISDSSGQLQFYFANDVLLNRNNDTLIDGSGFRSPDTYAGGIVILPFFKGSDLYHIFHVGEKDHIGLGWGYERLYHSVVDMTLGDGRGGVLVKGELLLDEVINEGISAVKHADGISWWLVIHENGNISDTDCSNKFFKYLIQGASISGPYVQEIGTSDCIRDYPGGRAKFFSLGNRMIYMDYFDQITELYDFDRCTGELSNPILLGNNLPAYGAETSPDGRYLYLSDKYAQGASSNLYKYDLLAENIPASRETLAVNPTGDEPLGQMLLAVDGKIYLSSGPPWTWPQYISVINFPNLQGNKCGFEPLSFYLGEDALTFGDLPNMPNYALPALGGEPCLTESDNIEVADDDLKIYPNPASDYLCIENNKQYISACIYDLVGRTVMTPKMLTSSEHFDISTLVPGLYTITFSYEGSLNKSIRFIKQRL